MMEGLTRNAPKALAALRIITALLFAEHGTQKLFGFPAMGRLGPPGGGAGAGAGGPPPGTDGGMGATMATVMLIAGILETFGGLAILLGLLTRPIAFILAGECAVIFWGAHVAMMGHGNIFPISNGGESAVLFCFTFLYLVFAGPGAFSVDGMIGGRKPATA